MAPLELNFITGNANKLAEVQAILGGTVELKSQSLDLLEIQGTIEEVSKTKCHRAAEIVSRLKKSHQIPSSHGLVDWWTGSSGRYMSLLQSI